MASSITTKNRIIEQAMPVHAADDNCKAARVQALDHFIALDNEARAAHWRHLSADDRHALVTSQLVRVDGDTSEANIAGWVARYNERYGSEPTGTERMVVEALRDMAHQADDVRSMRAAQKAIERYCDGQRAYQQADGSWRVPSASEIGSWYTVSREGQCDCIAALHAQDCWHASQVAGIELAYERQDLFDDGYAVADFGRRLAHARAQVLSAA